MLEEDRATETQVLAPAPAQACGVTPGKSLSLSGLSPGVNRGWVAKRETCPLCQQLPRFHIEKPRMQSRRWTHDVCGFDPQPTRGAPF